MNCPVCNKSGIPDFTQKPLVCPQCDSDLTQYYLLKAIIIKNEVKDNEFELLELNANITLKRKKLFKYLAILSVLATFCFFAHYCYWGFKSNNIITDNTKKVLSFQDSIKSLQVIIANAKTDQSEIQASQNEIEIHYKVKNGDYPSKIAQFFYNDWLMYKKIESDNNLQQPYILKVGQILKIKLKLE